VLPVPAIGEAPLLPPSGALPAFPAVAPPVPLLALTPPIPAPTPLPAVAALEPPFTPVPPTAAAPPCPTAAPPPVALVAALPALPDVPLELEPPVVGKSSGLVSGGLPVLHAAPKRSDAAR
jgi:hypothetical protein